MTKSDQKPVKSSKNNIEANDEKCHFMSQLMLEEQEKDVEISQLVDALRKIGYFESFQPTNNQLLSSDKRSKTQCRKIKHKKKARYRKIKRYYKSPEQYQKERIRRKLCWLLSGKHKESEIAEMLGISRRTVIRDINKIRPYYYRMSRAFFRELHAERQRAVQAKLATMSLWQRLSYLTDLIIQQRKQMKRREYNSHFTILTLDMTQPDHYGIPKLTMFQKGCTMAYPHKVRVHIIGAYEGRKFEADIGGFNIVQTTRSLW